MLLNDAKCQGYSFYCFWVIEGKPTGGGGVGKITLPLPHLLRLRLMGVLQGIRDMLYVKQMAKISLKFL